MPGRINGDLTLDFDGRLGARPGHSAFLVDHATFDRALSGVKASSFERGFAPRWGDRQIHHIAGGRGGYLRDRDGIACELFTWVSSPA